MVRQASHMTKNDIFEVVLNKKALEEIVSQEVCRVIQESKGKHSKGGVW